MNERRGQSAANNNRIYPSAFFIARPASTPTPSLQHQHPIINKLFYCPTDSRGTRPSLSSLNLFIPCTLLWTKYLLPPQSFSSSCCCFVLIPISLNESYSPSSAVSVSTYSKDPIPSRVAKSRELYFRTGRVQRMRLLFPPPFTLSLSDSNPSVSLSLSRSLHLSTPGRAS